MNNLSRLKYVVLSDLHLGEKDSLFTPGMDGDYRLVHALSDALAELIKSLSPEEMPAFIFNGDILGLAFSTYRESLSTLREFMHAFTERNHLCERLIYIPGNHDHHVWALAMEEHFVSMMAEASGTHLPEMVQITPPQYDKGFPSAFFKAFLSGVGQASALARARPRREA